MAATSPAPNVLITTNSDTEARTTSFLPAAPPSTQAIGPKASMTYIYSTKPSFTLDHNADLLSHQAAVSSGPPYVSFPVAGSSSVVYLNFDPNPEQEEGQWHRTQTVDYVVILDGELELSLDDGERKMVKKGDVVVQRAAMHKWKNPSKTEKAGFLAVLLGADGAVEGGVEYGGENLK